MKKFPAALLFFLLLLQACNNEVDINAPARETPVVYGFIDPNDSLQYIRISRTFQTTSSSLPSEAARSKTALYFDSLHVTIRNTRTGQVFQFYRTNDIPKDPGYFGTDANYLYSDFHTMGGGQGQIIPTDLYELDIYSPASGNHYRSTTAIVENADIRDGGVPLYLSPYMKDGAQRALRPLKALTGVKGALYDFALRLNYKEMKDGVTTFKYIDYAFVKNQVVSPAGNSLISTLNNKQLDFLNYLHDNIPPDPSLLRRFMSLELVAYGGSSDLLDYYNLFKPSSSISQKKPEYSNINGALGIFSSRNQTFKLITVDTLTPLSEPQADSTVYHISHYSPNFVYP